MHVDDLLARRVARAGLEVAQELESAGSVVRRRQDWPGSPEEWAAAAAAAEGRLQRPVASGFSPSTSTVWATLLDWPRSAEELLAAARRNQVLAARMGGEGPSDGAAPGPSTGSSTP